MRGASVKDDGAGGVRLWILTDWGLFVKKLQYPVAQLRPRITSLLMRVCGIIVLNAELKFRNNSLTYESLFSRCVRAWWDSNLI